MALHFRRGNALLLLTPKTGSTWIRATVRELGLDVVEVGDPTMREHDRLADVDRTKYAYIGAFVRNPVDWYRSYWSYRMERGWRPQYPLDRECESDDFTAFVRSAVSVLPGALGNIYDSYTGGPGAPIDFIGRQERLAEDFARFLRAIGEDVDDGELNGKKLINNTVVRPDYSEELKEIITVSEWETMARHGYLAERPDPIGLGEMQARYPEYAADLRLLVLWTEKIHWAPDDRKVEAGRPIRQSTRHARVHSNFALYAQHKIGDLDYAEDRYRRALALDPNHPRTLCNYALFTWKHRDNPAGARDLMLTALAGRPNHPYTLGRLATLTDRALGDPALAEVLFKQSLAANPAQPDVKADFAGLLLRAGRTADAVDLLEADAHRPDADPATLLAFASVLLASGSVPEALEFRQRALV